MKALQDRPPTSLHQLRHFLGLLNYYSRFITHCADLLSPLSDLLRNRKKKNEQISLNDMQLKAINEVKEKLAATSLLAHLVPDAQFSLVIDVSGTAVGAEFCNSNTNSSYKLSRLFFETAETRQNNVTAMFSGRELLAM